MVQSSSTKVSLVPHKMGLRYLDARSVESLHEHRDGIQTLDLLLNEHSDERSLASLHVPNLYLSPPRVVNSQQNTLAPKDFLLFVKAGANSGPILLIFWGPSPLSPSPMLTPSFS